jgi:hypothetical protein
MLEKTSFAGEPIEEIEPVDDDPSETAEWLDALGWTHRELYLRGGDIRDRL